VLALAQAIAAFSEEIMRISAERGPGGERFLFDGAGTLGSRASAIAAVRRQRHRFIPNELLGEPAWDMLLELYCADKQNKRIYVKQACLAAQVPEATAVRTLDRLEELALATRIVDPSDTRRKFVGLTAAGREMLDAYFRSMPAIGDLSSELIHAAAQMMPGLPRGSGGSGTASPTGEERRGRNRPWSDRGT
jgi:DNA-binding MarR family transcriptional regulator